MRRVLSAIGIVGLSVLSACDAFFVEPARPTPEVELSLVPATAAAGVVYGDLTPGLGPVRQVQFQFIHDGLARDTLVRAVRSGATLQTRVILRPTEATGWLEVRAELQMESGAPTLRGHGLVNTRALVPQATIEVEPVAAFIAGPEPSPITALGVTVTPTAVPMFASSIAIDGAVVDWASDTPSILEAIGSVLVSRGNGTAVVTASSLGTTRDYVVVVRQLPVVLTGVGPADTAVSSGATFQARPFGQDRNGHALRPGSEVTWTSTGAVSVTAEGLVTASSAGAGSVSVSHGTTSHWMQVTVLP